MCCCRMVQIIYVATLSACTSLYAQASFKKIPLQINILDFPSETLDVFVH